MGISLWGSSLTLACRPQKRREDVARLPEEATGRSRQQKEKRVFAGVAQSVEHSLGKGEVEGATPFPSFQFSDWDKCLFGAVVS